MMCNESFNLKIKETMLEVGNDNKIKKVRAFEEIGRELAISDKQADRARQIREKNVTVKAQDQLFQYFIDEYIFQSAHLTKENETIYFEYEKCQCPVALNDKSIRPEHCLCIQGYIKEFFEELFDSFIEVEQSASFVNGDNSCKLSINIVDDTKNWINYALTQIKNIKNDEGIELIEKCGRQCGKSHNLADSAQEIRDLVSDKNDLDQLFKLYKENIYQNSPGLYKEDNAIYLEYRNCGCTLVNEKKVSDPFFCNCTRGYTKERFEALFNRKVEVELLKSILRGDSICKQKITIL